MSKRHSGENYGRHYTKRKKKHQKKGKIVAQKLRTHYLSRRFLVQILSSVTPGALKRGNSEQTKTAWYVERKPSPNPSSTRWIRQRRSKPWSKSGSSTVEAAMLFGRCFPSFLLFLYALYVPPFCCCCCYWWWWWWCRNPALPLSLSLLSSFKSLTLSYTFGALRCS